MIILCACMCLCSVDLDSSGNLRPSPLNSGARAKKLTALQKSLHGREVISNLSMKDVMHERCDVHNYIYNS